MRCGHSPTSPARGQPHVRPKSDLVTLLLPYQIGLAAGAKSIVRAMSVKHHKAQPAPVAVGSASTGGTGDAVSPALRGGQSLGHLLHSDEDEEILGEGAR